MAEIWRTVRRLMSVSACLVTGTAWLTAVLYVVLGNVIIRETPVGRIADHIDRLPSSFARPAFVLGWCLFFLGWIVPLALGLKRLFWGDDGGSVHL